MIRSIWKANQRPLYRVVFALGAVFDQLMGVVYYFAVVQNLYWLAIVLVSHRSLKETAFTEHA